MPESCSKLPFRNALRLVRLQRGLSQQQLAVLVGVRRPTISRYEAGDRIVSGDRVGELAAALQIDPGLFYRINEESDELQKLVPLEMPTGMKLVAV
jgi:transcriptional regulator with XRE-family HTH domain